MHVRRGNDREVSRIGEEVPDCLGCSGNVLNALYNVNSHVAKLTGRGETRMGRLTWQWGGLAGNDEG